MGLSLEFYAGDGDTIGAAIADIDFDRIRGGADAIAYADLSIHVSSDDLDLLSEVIAERAAQTPLLLLDCLTRTVGSIGAAGEEGAAQVVDPEWVSMVAMLSLSDAPIVSVEWIRRVGEALGETLEPSDDAARAVESLISLCKAAVSAHADVVHLWYL